MSAVRPMYGYWWTSDTGVGLEGVGIEKDCQGAVVAAGAMKLLQHMWRVVGGLLKIADVKSAQHDLADEVVR